VFVLLATERKQHPWTREQKNRRGVKRKADGEKITNANGHLKQEEKQSLKLLESELEDQSIRNI